MSELVRLRQRIKAIETIKKMTHAMRLIAMSSHSKYKAAHEPLVAYEYAVDQLFHKLKALVPQWTNTIVHSQVNTQAERLVILIGSQKGLCGTFNTYLFKFFEHYLTQQEHQPTQIIGVGLKAVDYLTARYPNQLIDAYRNLTARNNSEITEKIARYIETSKYSFASVVIIGNTLKKFFMQKPTITHLLPLNSSEDQNLPKKSPVESESDYIWEQNPQELLDLLVDQYLQTHIYSALFQSLLAEQAARFISMDSSTRNADNMLQETKLWYNKLRQAKITKELTERAEV